jgi:hypothetical protein
MGAGSLWQCAKWAPYSNLGNIMGMSITWHFKVWGGRFDDFLITFVLFFGHIFLPLFILWMIIKGYWNTILLY